MQQAKKVAKNTGFLYARMAITVFISLYSTRLVLEALGAVDFGIFNVVAGAIAMLTFLNVAMTSATQRFMSYAEGKGDFNAQVSIFNTSIILHFFIGLAVVLILEISAIFLFSGILEIPDDRIFAAKVIFQCMVFSTFFKIISVPYDAVINAHENMLLVAILGVVESLLKLGIAIYITITLFDNLIVYGFLMALMAVVLLIFRRVYCHKAYTEVIISPRKYYSKTAVKEMGSFAGWSFLHSSASMLSNYGQGIVLNIFFGPVVNAAQGVANQVNGQLGAFSTTMMTALNPTIAKSEGAGDRKLMLKASTTGSKLSFLLFSFFALPAIVEMDYILEVWLIDVPDFAVIFCILLLFKNLIEQLFIPLSSSIRAVGNIKLFTIYQSIINLSPLFLCYLLFVNNYPPYYLYLIFILTSSIGGCLSLLFAKKLCDLPLTEFLKDVIFRCLLVFTCVFISTQIPFYFLKEGLLRLSLVILTSSLMFLISILSFGFSSEEKQFIYGLGSKISSRINKKIKRLI